MRALQVEVGGDVTVMSTEGRPLLITRIVSRPTTRNGDVWITHGGGRWSRSGLSVRVRGKTRPKIVVTTKEHRRLVRARLLRVELSLSATWEDVSDDVIEQVAAILGLEV